MKKSTGITISLFFLSILLLASPSVLATVLDVSAGTDSVIYKPTDNVTVSGVVRNAITKQPITSATVTVAATKGSTTVHSGSYSTDANGKYSSDPFTVSSTGTHTVTATAVKLSDSGGVTGYFDVESEKRYTLTTDTYSYSVGDNATITLTVLELPDETGVSGQSLLVKIKRPNGTLLQQDTLTTNANGVATTTFTIPGNGEFVAVAGKGLAMAVFEAPAFKMKVNVLGSDGKKKDMFAGSDQLKVKVTTTKESSTSGSTPVKNVDVTTYIKDISGTTMHTFTSTNETSDGVYETGLYSLSSLSNGDYYVQVDAVKGSSSMTSKAFFSIKSLRVDIAPIGEMEGVMSFLKGKDVTLGLFVMNLDNGETLSENEIYGAEIVSCKDMKGKSCLSKIAGSLNNTQEGFREFPKILIFTAPNQTGEYFIEIDVNTSAGRGRGGAHVFVQDVIAYTETMDKFGGWRWRYGPGENVTLRVNAFSGSYSMPETVNSVQILEIRNDSWSDIIDSVIPNTTLRTASGCEISFSAPSTSGWFSIRLSANTSGGQAYSGAHFDVQLYDVWVDMMDGPNATDNWRWKFGATDDVYFHLNVFNLGGYSEDNRINSSLYTMEVTGLRYEVTGKTYTNLNVTDYGEIADDSWGRPVLKLNLSGLNLPSGHYATQLEMTDLDGNKGYFEAWFKISNLNVWTMTTTNSGEQGKWRFEPTENVTIKVNAQYFNGTNIPDGSEVIVMDLMYAQKGPPMPVPSDVWTSFSGTTTSGEALVRVKAQSGKSLSQGQYMAMINVTPADGSGTEEIEESWFEVSAMDVYGWAQPPYVSTGMNVSIMVTATKTDGSSINTTMQLAELRDAMSWSDVRSKLTNPPDSKNSSSTTTNFNFSTDGLSTGEYEAVIRVSSEELGAKSDVYTWFSIQNYAISGEFVDNSKRVYAPEEDVEMYITIQYPNGTNIGNENVTVYQLVDTESWPWNFVTATMVGTPDPTDQYSGKTRVTFKAPRSSGRYRPMVNVSGELQTDPWLLPDFEVRSADVRVTLKDENGNVKDNFKASSTVQVQVDVSNPTGGMVSLSSIALRYKDLDTNDETTLQTVTSNLGESNLINFTSPSTNGDYVLFVSVTDNTTGNVIIEKRWFRVKTFELHFWMEWSVQPGQNATLHVDAWNPDGTPATVTLSLEELNDMWTWTTPSGYTLESNPKTISGSGDYGIPAPNEMGEYDVKICVYNESEGCLEGSQRIYMGFSVQSYEIYTWPMQGSYTTDDNVELAVEVNNGGFVSTDNFTVNVLELRNARTWTNATSLMGSTTQNTQGSMRIINFSAANLGTGEYSMMVNVTYDDGTENRSRQRDIWFRISDFQLTLNTVPPLQEWEPRRFFVNQNITFNVTVSPAPSSSTEGKLRLVDDMSWFEVENYDITINDTGQTTQTLSVDSSGYYTVIAEIGDAQEHFWFQVGAYDVGINDWMSTHEVGMNENISVVFNLTYPNGTEYAGDVNVTIKNIRRTMDWSPISGTQNLNFTTVSASLGSYEYYNFTLPPEVGAGEYEAEIEFMVDGMQSMEHFWFQQRSKMFDAWTTQYSYEPGENVTIKAELRYANGTAWEGVNISIEEIWNKDTWQQVSVTPIVMYADTDSNGQVNLNFTLPNDISGMVDVRLMEQDGNEIRWMSFSVSGYDITVYRPNNKWVYLPGEMFSADVYVRKSGVLESGVNITAYLWEAGTEWSEGNEIAIYNPGLTGANGYIWLNFTVPNVTNHYEVEIDAGNGAAKWWEGFDVATFFVDIWLDGNMSGSDKVSEGESVTATVYVKYPNGTSIPGANVSFIECRKVPEWSPASCSVTKDDQATDSSGRAELKFNAPAGQNGEFVARFNISYNDSGVESQMDRDSWFMISPFSYSLEFVCPPDAPSGCNPEMIPPGGQLTANINVSGTLNYTCLCLDSVKNMWTNTETYYGYCGCGDFNTSSANVSITAPEEVGDYDAKFRIYVWPGEFGNESGDMFEFEEWRWFKIEGSSSGMMMNTWIEPCSVWAGDNASVYIDVWDSNWNNIDLMDCSVYVNEIRKSQDWMLIKNYSDITQYPLQDQGGMDPNAYILPFEVPSDLAVGDYEVKVVAECSNVSLSQFQHFQVPAFQASSLIREMADTNEFLYFWFRVTDKNGNPIQGKIYKDKLVDPYSWNVLQEYNEQFDLDANGEYMGNITTPSNPGEFELELRVENSSITQQLWRHFQVTAMDAKVSLAKDVFFKGEHVIATVNVTNDSGPVENAVVQLRLFSMMKGPMDGGGECNESSNESCDQYQSNEIQMNNNTDSTGIATFNMTYWANGTLNSSDYMLQGDVNTQDWSLWARVEKTFMVRGLNTTVTIPQSFIPGDTIPVNITSLNQSGAPAEGLNVTVELMKMMMGPPEEDNESDSALAECSGLINDTGQLDCQLQIPSWSNITGPAVVLIDIEGELNGENISDSEEYLIVIHNPTADLQMTMSSGPHDPGSMFDVWISCNASNISLSVASFVRHMSKTGNAVPVFEVMGGGPESGKENYYENPMYFNSSAEVHLKVLAQEHPGNYTLMIPFFDKDTTSMMMAEPVEMMFSDYSVSAL